MASGVLQSITISPVKERFLVKGRPVFVFLADDLSRSASIDFYAARRISTIIAAAFSGYSDNIGQGFDQTDNDLLPETGYLVKPSILAWHKNTGESDSDDTHIMVRVDFLDARSGDLLDTLIVNRGIKFQMQGLNHPCELFIGPIEDSLQRMYG